LSQSQAQLITGPLDSQPSAQRVTGGRVAGVVNLDLRVSLVEGKLPYPNVHALQDAHEGKPTGIVDGIPSAGAAQNGRSVPPQKVLALLMSIDSRQRGEHTEFNSYISFATLAKLIGGRKDGMTFHESKLPGDSLAVESRLLRSTLGFLSTRCLIETCRNSRTRNRLLSRDSVRAGRRLHAAKTEMIRARADLAFSACANYVA
jgi:hypothetical protein